MANKVTLSRKARKPILLLDGEQAFVGVDVHKRKYHVAVWTARRQVIKDWVMPPDPQALCRLLKPIADRIGCVAYEAGPTGYELARILEEHGYQVLVVPPSRTPRATGRSAKSDRLDCRKLAMLAGKGMLGPVHVPTREQEADRQVLRRREQVAKDLRRIKTRIKSFLLQHGLGEPAGLEHWSLASIEALRTLKVLRNLRVALDSHLADLDHATRQLALLDAEVRKLAKTERYGAVVERLCSVPGVGVLTAMVFCVELPDRERFATSQQLSAYLGLAPWVGESGETRRRGPLMKAGNRHVRRQLVEVAWQWIRYDPEARRTYHRLVSNTGTPNKAICGMARRLGIRLWELALDAEGQP